MMNKLTDVVKSRRFWVAVGGMTFVIFNGMGLDLSPDQINHVVLLGGAWIVGDSLRVA